MCGGGEDPDSYGSSEGQESEDEAESLKGHGAKRE